MSRTIRNIPHRYSKQTWIPDHQAAYLPWSSLRDGKSDRGDGVTCGWLESMPPKAKREAKRLARRSMRRAARRMEQECC